MYWDEKDVFIFIMVILIILLCWYGEKYDTDEYIYVDKDLFDKYVDIITSYSIKGNKLNEKLVNVYMSSFAILDRNYRSVVLEKVNNRLKLAYLYEDPIKFPKWSNYDYIQIVIANTINKWLYRSERNIGDNFVNNRTIIKIYVDKLFDNLGIIRI